MKKFMALVLSVSMVLCAVPSFVFADTASDGTTAPGTGTPEVIRLTDANTKIDVAEGPYVYTGKAIEPTVTITYTPSEEGAAPITLVKDTDYEITYENNINASAATSPAKVKITGKGKYDGTVDEDFTISKKEFTAADKPAIDIPTQNVNEVMSNVEIIWNGMTLTEGIDFTVEGDNSKAGTQIATVSFKGNYGGEVTVQYNVVSNDIKDAAFYLTDLNRTYTYDGTAKEPGVRLVMDGRTLVKDTDYTVKYEDNINAGTAAKIVITGIGDYAGELTETFAIAKANLSDTNVVFDPDAYTATGEEIRPVAGVDFKVYLGEVEVPTSEYTVNSYTNNVAIGNATVTLSIPATAANGNFTGVKTATFKIVNKAVADLDVTLEKSSYEYTGSKVEPTVTVKDGEKVLVKDTDYTVTYGENTNAGTGTVTITGKGASYVGTKTVEFAINGKNAGIITGYNTYTRYWPNASALNLKTRTSADAEGFIYTANNPDIATVDPSGNVYIRGTGKATITIETYGTKEYNPAKKTVTINVKPRKPAIKVTSPAKKQVKVTITKVQGATKYQVKYGRNGVYYNKYITHKDTEYKTVYTLLKNRTSGKTYEIKVRAYKTMPDGTKVWGNWTTKKIKVK